jgi:hypothetical protein
MGSVRFGALEVLQLDPKKMIGVEEETSEFPVQ